MPAVNPYGQLVKNQSFVLFLVNCALGSLGHGLTYICLAWLSQSDGSSLSSMALVMLGFWAPSLILAVPVGTFIDRGNERIAAIMANGARGLLLVVIAFFMEGSSFVTWQLFLIALSLGCFNAFYAPSIGVIIRKIIPEPLLLYGNTLGDGCIEFFSILGMGTSGFLLGALGLKATLLCAGVGLILAALCFVPIKNVSSGFTVQKSLHACVAVNWRELLRTPNLVQAYVSSGVLYFLMMATPVLLAPYIKALAFTSLFDFSMLEACYSVGAVLGALVLPVMITKNKTVSLCSLWTLLALAYVSFAFFPNRVVWHCSYILIGLCISTWAVVHTEVQSVTPLQIQGRLLAYNNGLWGSMVFVTFFFSNSVSGSHALRNFYVGFALLSLVLMLKRIPLRMVRRVLTKS